MTTDLKDKSVLLVITGGIAAYKSLELIRLLRKDGAKVRAILTKGGAEFVTPLSVSALCENPVYEDLFSLKDEAEMGHIRLTREADLIIVAPATADFMAKMAHGLANDLASTTLLATDDETPILIAPAMNHRMWGNKATQANVATLKKRGLTMIGPDIGDMACGEHGPGRMSEPQAILEAAREFFFNKPLAGYNILVTSGPTYEPIDPVRFIGNRSSGKQGHAIAAALRKAGAEVTLVSGPVNIPDPAGVKTIHIETAAEMLAACEAALPATDIAICAAAVSDWGPENAASQKIKKSPGAAAPTLSLKENPDILKTISNHKSRPALVVGFAAETENLIANATKKLNTKGCDWILANNVAENAFGGDKNHVFWLSHAGQEDWGTQSKAALAEALVAKIIQRASEKESLSHAPNEQPKLANDFPG